MEKDCLQTKLKGIVNNEELFKIGELVINMTGMPAGNVSRAGVLSVKNTSIPTTARILNNNQSVEFTNGTRTFVVDNSATSEERSIDTTQDTKIAIDNPSNVLINFITEHNHNILQGMSLLTYTNDLVFLKTYDAPADFFFTMDKIKPFLNIPTLYRYELRNDSYRGSLEEQVLEIVNAYIGSAPGRIFTIYNNMATMSINGVPVTNMNNYSFRIESPNSISIYLNDVTCTVPERIIAEYDNGTWTYPEQNE